MGGGEEGKRGSLGHWERCQGGEGICTSRNWLEHRREREALAEGDRPGIGKSAKGFAQFVGQIGFKREHIFNKRLPKLL